MIAPIRLADLSTSASAYMMGFGVLNPSCKLALGK
jgi:hypothetical protein